jgi:Tfp pilus assembly protein PilF
LGGLGAALVAAVAWSAIPMGNAPTPAVMTELRRIEAAQTRLQVDPLRMEYQELARNSPSDVMLRVYIAWCSMPSDDTWNQLKGYASVNPDHPWLHYGMGRVFLAWKDKDSAKKEFDAILKKDPKFYPAIIGLADLARQKDDLDGAEQQYKAALAIQDDATAWAGLGFLAAARNKPEEARQAFKKSVAQFPDQPGVLERLVKTGLEVKDPETAEYAQKLVELQPRNREARKTLADLQFQAGDKKGATASYEKLFRLGDPEPELARRLAGLYQEAGAAEDEERVLELLSRLDKKDASLQMRLAELAEAKKDTQKLEGRLLDALDRDPSLALAHYKLGLIKRDAKVLHEAVEQFQAAGALQGPGSAEGKAEAEKIIKDFDLPKPFGGDVDAINWKVSSTLGKLFEKRVLLKPGLNGILKVRVSVDKDGNVGGVSIVEDSIGDPVLTGHAYFALKTATWPKKRREPVFEFELGKKKGK